METTGHCLRCNQTFTGEWCPRCDAIELTQTQPATHRPAGKGFRRPAPRDRPTQVVHDLYAEARAGTLHPQQPPPHLIIQSTHSDGARVAVRTLGGTHIDLFRVQGNQVAHYVAIPDPDPTRPLAACMPPA